MKIIKGSQILMVISCVLLIAMVCVAVIEAHTSIKNRPMEPVALLSFIAGLLAGSVVLSYLAIFREARRAFGAPPVGKYCLGTLKEGETGYAILIPINDEGKKVENVNPLCYVWPKGSYRVIDDAPIVQRGTVEVTGEGNMRMITVYAE